MYPVKKWTIAFFLLFVMLVAGTGMAYATLKSGYQKAIEIAFMNGFVTAARLNVDAIRQLQDRKDLLRATAEKASADYIKKVDEMNAGKP